jgi:hypothetical protein
MKITQEQSDNIEVLRSCSRSIGCERTCLLQRFPSPPFVMHSAFIDEAHKIGHSGEKRTVDLLRERISFPGMTKFAKMPSRAA